MKIEVNNRPTDVSPELNIRDLLLTLGFTASKGLAVAVNNRVISREAWNTYIIKENDKITLIKATQGG